ncbi:MAG: hypothetical protein MHPDNHAH_02836 [Anaerolineales bacterium]|nr:hypothetical protein [Anaerolineales bacterium]
MVEDAQRIFDYLPISFRNETEQEYVNFLWETFVANYESEKYHFAFLAYHMLFMSFVYFEIWQIKVNSANDFEKAMVGFNKEMENELMIASTPFMLWRVNETSVFRFLKLIGMSNSTIGQCAKLVRERNDAAHSNGNIYFRDQKTIDQKIDEILNSMDVIQLHSEKVIGAFYENFLVVSADPDAREFISTDDQIREVLVYGNYLSPRDILYLQNYNCDRLIDKEKGFSIVDLIAKLQEMYPLAE